MPTVTERAREPEPLSQFSVFIPNRLGRLHEVTCRLAERQVHILALTVLDTTDSTILRFLVDDPDGARSLLGEHGFPFSETRVLGVEVEGEGSLKDVLHALLEAELNVHYTYPFLTRPGGRSALVISIEDQEVAEDALRRHQFTVLYQGDLSR
ncbi:MAG TPA: acetolactate synthase [Verrucomicrobiota bacterium]|nr:acetolactate synthase [Verrucomicrobiales bacterium]HRI14845.1 acetolactate synthase [Verrucomicrobiota bacterium]